MWNELCRNADIITLLREVGTAARVDRWKRCRARLFRKALCLSESGCRNRNIGRTLQPFGDQRIKLGVAIGAPPLAGRPVALLRCGKALRRSDRRRWAHRWPGTQIGHSSAGGEHRTRHYRCNAAHHIFSTRLHNRTA